MKSNDFNDSLNDGIQRILNQVPKKPMTPDMPVIKGPVRCAAHVIFDADGNVVAQASRLSQAGEIVTALNRQSSYGSERREMVRVMGEALEHLNNLSAAADYLEHPDLESGDRYGEAATDVDKFIPQLRAAIQKLSH